MVTKTFDFFSPVKRVVACPSVGYRYNAIAGIRDIQFRSDCVIFDLALLEEKLSELRPWFTLDKNTYLWESDKNIKLPLLKYEGIPPILHSTGKRKARILLLYFALPENWEQLDYLHIIEGDSPNSISQFKICLTQSAEEKLEHCWEKINSISDIPDL